MRIVARMVVAALVLGTVAAIVGTGRVTLSLVLSGAAMWSFVPVLQLLTGLMLVARRRHERARALTEYFATGHYWNLWLLGMGGVLLLVPEANAYVLFLAITMVVPLILTARALQSIAPRSRVLVHQALTLGLLLAYAAWAVGGWPRVAGLLRGA